MGQVELKYPDGTDVIFDEDYWLWFGEMTVADMHYQGSSTENIPNPYLDEQD